MQLIDRLREKIKTDKVSVLKISTKTGISAYKIYKWLDRKGSPKHEDVVKLEQYLSGGLEKVPESHQKAGNASSLPDLTGRHISQLEKNIKLLEEKIANSDDLKEILKEIKEIAKQNNDLLTRYLVAEGNKGYVHPLKQDGPRSRKS